jgi:RNA polymerase sigma factor (sigma-70 family)
MNAVKTLVSEREDLFVGLYKTAFPAIARYIHRKGGSLDEARDIFQDALIVYYEKSVQDPSGIQSSKEAYIFGIARHLWSKKFRENNRLYDGDLSQQPNDEEPSVPSMERISRYLEVAGKKCMELLRAFYYDRLNMQETAAKFGFSGERSATVQKHKCIGKLRSEVKAKSLTYSDFYE